ncbi:DUF885 family protein [Agromyces sp. SYSU T00194]|uniref:DUF885 family protein n=1 Tax=Agromyces chitinivorans TaxID=3158560 RepID=UPI00339543C9
MHTPSSDASSVSELGRRFWTWRAAQQPRTSDDIPRIQRPEGWLPAWSRSDVAAARAKADEFAAEWTALPVPAPRGDRAHRAAVVDHALVGSAIARVRFELDVVAQWATHPGFYVDHTLGVVFDELLQLPPFDAARAERVARAYEHTPTVLVWARENLAGSMVRQFAEQTAANLESIGVRIADSTAALSAQLPEAVRDRVAGAARTAALELESFREWLVERIPGSAEWRPIGEDAVREFLRTVALNPLDADEMLAIGRRELARAEALSAIEGSGEQAPLLPDVEAQVEQERRDELAIREFYVHNRILSQPATLGHYLVAPMPAYLEPLKFLGVTDDLTDDDRVDLDGVSYMPAPVEGLPYFYDANARDPRAGIIHEGAHYQQLALSWRHPDALRRRYYDSGPNEGIAFYNEELMLRSGLFDDAPGTRAVVHSFLRLRALRVLVDLGLATGRYSVREAGALMADRVPMDLETAMDEAAFFAAIPVQGSTYQIGKAQIEAFLADAVRTLGDEFDLMAFHDFLWLNGNVPIALQRYELLGLDDELDRIRL